MPQPKISVIVPIYGVEKYLHQCIDSILAQSFHGIEIILIDDGSKDNCPHIIDEYALKDTRIIAIHQTNGGYGKACNTGLDAAKGEYISIIEPDDFIDRNMYKDLYNIATKNNSDIVKSAFYHYYDTPSFKQTVLEKFSDKIPTSSFSIYDCPLFLAYHPSIWSCIYKKDFLQKHNIRFIEAAGAGWTDNPFQVQTMCLAKRINYTPKSYYYWRRINIFDSHDLKDYTLPFKRSDEIHNWLDKQKIINDDILAALYKRELAYINIVLDMKTISNKNDYHNQIIAMCSRMKHDIIESNTLITNNEKRIYKQLMQNLKRYTQKLYFKKIRRFMLKISIKPTKKQFFIQFLGFRISKNKHLNIPYIFEIRL